MQRIARNVGGIDADDQWALIAQQYYAPNALASSMAFDYFAHLLARPQAGPHYVDDNGVVRSTDTDPNFPKKSTVVTVPNGATGFMGKVTYGGAPVENGLAQNQGDFNSQYTLNAGSYYAKIGRAHV